jgi:hypothetical protein
MRDSGSKCTVTVGFQPLPAPSVSRPTSSANPVEVQVLSFASQ